MKLRDNVQSWLTTSLSDPIVKIIAENSHLTRTQLETLLIDVLSDSVAGKQLRYDEKARFRLTKAKISRGAFNRSLRQARKNVTKSIYTVILLGYLGVFESTTLDEYLEVANKLHMYLDTYKDALNQSTDIPERLKALGLLRQELETSLEHLTGASVKQA